MGPIFTEAGFIVSTGGRRRALLGVYELLGLFSHLKAEDIINLPPGAQTPYLPERFHASYDVLYNCHRPGDRFDLCTSSLCALHVSYSTRARPGVMMNAHHSFAPISQYLSFI